MVSVNARSTTNLWLCSSFSNATERASSSSRTTGRIYVETIRPIYEADEIAAMLGHADQIEGIFLKFMLASGFRDREVRHVTWRDLDFRNSLVRVTAKCVLITDTMAMFYKASTNNQLHRETFLLVVAHIHHATRSRRTSTNVLSSL